MSKGTCLFISLLFFLLLLAACESLSLRKKTQEVDSLIFGINYGECIGECFTVFKLENEHLWEDTASSSLGDYLNYEFREDLQLSASEYEEVQGLIGNVPSELFNINNKTFGCPDCYDQGGVFIQFQKGNTSHRFLIDTDDSDDQSEDVVVFKKSVMSRIEELRN